MLKINIDVFPPQHDFKPTAPNIRELAFEEFKINVASTDVTSDICHRYNRDLYKDVMVGHYKYGARLGGGPFVADLELYGESVISKYNEEHPGSALVAIRRDRIVTPVALYDTLHSPSKYKPGDRVCRLNYTCDIVDESLDVEYCTLGELNSRLLMATLSDVDNCDDFTEHWMEILKPVVTAIKEHILDKASSEAANAGDLTAVNQAIANVPVYRNGVVMEEVYLTADLSKRSLWFWNAINRRPDPENLAEPQLIAELTRFYNRINDLSTSAAVWHRWSIVMVYHVLNVTNVALHRDDVIEYPYDQAVLSDKFSYYAVDYIFNSDIAAKMPSESFYDWLRSEGCTDDYLVRFSISE